MKYAILTALCLAFTAIAGCAAGTKINPAQTKLSQEVVYGPDGKPVSAKSNAVATGPGMSSDQAKDFAGNLGTPPMKLPPLPGNPVPPADQGGSGAVDNSINASFFSPASGAGRWVLFALGGLMILGGGLVAYLWPFSRMLGVGIACMGVLVIVATLFPILWFLLAVGALAWLAIDLWQSKKAHGVNQVAKSAVDAGQDNPGLLAYLNNQTDAASDAINRMLAGMAKRGKLSPKPDAPSDPKGTGQ